ncbi:MAG: hypothetical protein K8U57_28140 [Planctomycetes bacterium]|nr:hypothetical protein [Planctomycetota bacterium]
MATACNLACLLGVFAIVAGTATAQYPGGSGVPSPQNAPALPVPIPGTQPGFPSVVISAQEPKAKVEPPRLEQPKIAPVDPKVYTVLPERDKIFVMYDDAQLERIIMNSIREADKARPTPVKIDATYERTLQFPPMPEVGGGQMYQAKTASYPPMQTTYDALYLIHRRLHFEDKNSERYGWDLGAIQPLVSAVLFYKDVAMWPQSLASGVAYGFWDTNAGKCLPGSPTPYFLYPPGLTLTGSAFEAALLTGLAFVFP